MKKRLIQFITAIVVRTGRLKKKFLTVHTRPMFARDITYRGTENAIDKSCAIVMQGPIQKKYRFTYETVKLYSQVYPSATLVLSTWEGEDVSEFEALKQAGAKLEIVQTKAPEFGGPGNINRQTISTTAGIKRAQALGLTYVLKTRTDQRMYGIKNLEFLVHMLSLFPLESGTKQKNRIIGLNLTTTTRYTPYHLSDLWMFGTVEDMSTYWDYGYVSTKAPDPKHPFVERDLFIAFLKKTGWKVENTMDDFLHALGTRCIIVGNESIDLYWPKYYERFREYRIRDYDYPNFEISLKEWFNKCLPFSKS